MKDIKIELNTSNASGEAYWRKRCDEKEAELTSLRAECKRLHYVIDPTYVEPSADGKDLIMTAPVKAEITRLRAANAELVEAIRSLRPVIEKIHGLSEAVDAALSRAEQAKPETETCVWTVSENGVWIRPGCTGAQMLKGHLFIRPETCSYCKKKLIIEQAGKAEANKVRK